LRAIKPGARKEKAHIKSPQPGKRVGDIIGNRYLQNLVELPPDRGACAVKG
jgi:hypothetical protein